MRAQKLISAVETASRWSYHTQMIDARCQWTADSNHKQLLFYMQHFNGLTGLGKASHYLDNSAILWLQVTLDDMYQSMV